MTGKYDDKFHLDMPFDEALGRYAGVTPKEMHDNIRKAKKKKPPGGRKRPPGVEDDAQNVVRLRDRRERKNV